MSIVLVVLGCTVLFIILFCGTVGTILTTFGSFLDACKPISEKETKWLNRAMFFCWTCSILMVIGAIVLGKLGKL